jgi:FkbM family methyltransferase
MRNLLFWVFKKFRKIENFLCRMMRAFLLPIYSLEQSNRTFEKNAFYTIYHKLQRFRLDLYNFVYRRLRPKGIVLTEVDGNRIWIDADDLGISRVILMEDSWEKYETQCFKNILKEDMVVVDIGALFGHYSLIASKLVGKSGLVYAFEPVAKHFDILCRNIKLNGCTNITPVRKAVSNKCGKDKIWVDKFNIASASLLEENVLPVDNLSPNEYILPLYVSQKTDNEVETTTLDEFARYEMMNKKIDIIKMDVGGAEGLIIEGAEKILRSNDILHILMEFWPYGIRNVGTDPLQLLRKLEGYGFRIMIINEREQRLDPMGNVFEFCKRVKSKEEFNLLLEK